MDRMAVEVGQQRERERLEHRLAEVGAVLRKRRRDVRDTLAPELEEEMIAFAEREAQKCGLESLTAILDPDCGRQVGVTK